MKQLLSAVLVLGCLQTYSQEGASSESVLSRIFLPSIDVGYQIPNSDLISNSVKFSTALEYRFKNNNDFFVRVSYETYGAQYLLPPSTNTSNTIEGTVQMTDVFLAPGYRLGDDTFRFMFSIMPGIKLYEFPTAIINDQQIQIAQESKSIFNTQLIGTLEYYFDQKSALTISLFQNQVWNKIDFWEDGSSAVGFSIGFITSLL